MLLKGYQAAILKVAVLTSENVAQLTLSIRAAKEGKVLIHSELLVGEDLGATMLSNMMILCLTKIRPSSS